MSKSKMTPIKNSTYLFNYNSGKDNDREQHSYWLDSALTRAFTIDTESNVNQLDFTRLCHGLDSKNGTSQFRNSIEDFKQWHKDDARKEELLKNKNSLTEKEQSELRKLGSLRQMGWQCSFHATKSLAIAYECGDDQFKDTIDACMKKAFDAVGKEMTNDIKGHTLKGSKKGNEIAGLAIGIHIHRSNRAQDPSLHGHMSIPNVALGEDGKVKTISNWALCKNYHKYSAVFRAELAKELQKQGIAIESDKEYSFRLKAVPKELEQHFNKRTNAIDKAVEKHCKENGISIDSMSDKERSLLRDSLAMKLRDNKADITMRDKVHRWKQEIKELGHSVEKINDAVNKKDYSQIANRNDKSVAMEEIIKELEKQFSEKGKSFTEKSLNKIINDKQQFFDYDPKEMKQRILEDCNIQQVKGVDRKNGKEFSYSKFTLNSSRTKEIATKKEIEPISINPPKAKAPSKINQNFVKAMEGIKHKTHINDAFSKASPHIESSKDSGGSIAQLGNTDSLTGKEKFLILGQHCKAQAYQMSWEASITSDPKQRNELLSQAGALMQQAEMHFYQGLSKSKEIEI